MNDKIEVSVIVPISERHDSIRGLHDAYREALNNSGRKHEFLYVVDGDFPEAFSDLAAISETEENVRVIKFARWFGEATALSAGIENAAGDILVTLPAYLQVEPDEIPKLLDRLGNNDMVVARRAPRKDPLINRLQSRVFHWLIGMVGGRAFKDLGCSVRVFKRSVFEDVPFYGDQHRFLPLLVSRYGFRVEEIPLTQAKADQFRRTYPFGVYIRRFLDILTVFFLIKFTKKPLRFFGLIGVSTAAVGGIILLYVVVERLFFGTALADRPALLLSSLLVVLGVQIFALGLIGELVIFAHAQEIKEYTIERIVMKPLSSSSGESSVGAESSTIGKTGSSMKQLSS